METGGPTGVLTFDKPSGWTSHDLVARVRRALRTRSVGHAGTLDPMATGVLVVLVGEATKLAPWLTAQDKTYEATVAFGVETDTLDAEGREVRRAPVSPELRAALAGWPSGSPLLADALEIERTRSAQVPPAYSAIQTAGERSYAMARRGEAPTHAPRAVRVASLELTACEADPAQCSLSLEVSKGYYVRSLGRDLAGSLGTAGHLTKLRRLKSGPFDLGSALELDAQPEAMRRLLMPLALAASKALPVAYLTTAGTDDARHGRRVQPADLSGSSAGPCAWLDAAGTLVAIGEIEDDGGGKVLRGFAPTSPESPCVPLAETP